MVVIKDICFAVGDTEKRENFYLDFYPPREYNITQRDYDILRGTTTAYQTRQASVKYDAVQQSDVNVNCTSHRQHCLDSENDVETTARNDVKTRTRSPFVVFVHGGGWRRGGREAWKHFLYYDVNFLVCMCQWLVGTYGNVGEDMSKAGIGCAVISYPLSEAGVGTVLLELVSSYVMSCLAVTLLALPFIGLALCGQYMFLNELWFPRGANHYFPYAIKDILLCVMFVTNVAILSLFSVKRQEYRLKSRHIQLLWLALAVTGALFHHTFQERLYEVILTLVVTQAILFRRRMSRCGTSYDHQVKVVAKAVRWSLQLGRSTGIFDPRKIYLMGHSAGGHLASLAVLDHKVLNEVGYSPNDIKGVISLSGVYDLSCLDRLPLRPVYLQPTFGNCPKIWRKASPKHLVKQTQRVAIARSALRFLLISAEKDPFLKEQALRFYEVLQEAGLDCHHIEIKGANHFSVITNLNLLRKGNAVSTLTHMLQFID